ncbi:hypothetical protein NL676_018014 [Syzygium grande]|nr:hypothetical protein NL676_018014 [Syzygium grande]
MGGAPPSEAARARTRSTRHRALACVRFTRLKHRRNARAWISRAGRKPLGAITPANITASINSIPMLNGTNFKSWQENLLIVLGVMDLDLALRIDSPTLLNDQSTSDQKKDMERWERSNRMCMMIMKKAIPEAFRGTMSEKITTAKEFLIDIEKRFVKSEKG